MLRFTSVFLPLFALLIPVYGQEFQKALPLKPGASVEIRNHSGRVVVSAAAAAAVASSNGENAPASSLVVTAASDKRVEEAEVIVSEKGGRVSIDVPAVPNKQIDLTITVPYRSRLKVETLAGSVNVAGNFESIDVKTDTGTITTDIPDDEIKYELLWTTSRPRFLADFEISEVKEGSGGKFSIKGRYTQESDASKKSATEGPPAEKLAENTTFVDPEEEKQKKKKKTKDEIDPGRRDVALKFTTGRGIVLLNVDPSEVGSDLRERPLTNAAKAIVRSGDQLLMDAIRRASPKYFSEYWQALPPAKREPFIAETSSIHLPGGEVKTMLVSVTDINNRAIADLDAKDFEIVENGQPRDVVSVRPVTAPFNLVLLLDVSGSVDTYVNFIRKAARAFVDTMGPQDRISIIIFNDDVKVLSQFTTDKQLLSESLDTFDAGGGTGYYDSLGYVLTDTLRPLRGDRTAIVVLTDGDDNRSFLPFESLLGALQESGALVYPLYVPSSLIAASATEGQERSLDAMRTKYMGLTTKAEGEGERLARASGGVYYPITQLAQIQTAYNDIAKQLRTAYSVTFRSAAVSDAKTARRLRVKVKRENAFVKFASQ